LSKKIIYWLIYETMSMSFTTRGTNKKNISLVQRFDVAIKPFQVESDKAVIDC